MKVNTNPRYRGFNQTYFTAGDEDQFMKGRDYSDVGDVGDVGGEKDTIPTLYHNLSGEDVTNTFRYIFHKFKKGIYIRIKDNRLLTFLPFSKAKFINEWGDRIKVQGGDILAFIRHVYDLDGRQFYEKSVNKFTSGWYANNGLVRYEFPLAESDTGTHHIRDMFEQLCENRKVPDIELFVNRRDFPLLKTDGTEPYDHIWDDDSKPLVSHKYERYIPILSSVGHGRFADIPIPTTEDWSRVRSFEGVSFPRTSDKWDYDFSTPWKDRKPTAVFRGSSTGIGVTIETNPRLKIASIISPIEDGFPLLDAGITDWKVRPRKIRGQDYLQTVEYRKFPFGKVDRLTPEQQAQYRYIVNIDGHVSAFRLSLELNMGCVILKVDSDYRMWMDLKPYVHYVPVKRDLSDLLDKIRWCRTHDSECRKMVEACREYYALHLGKDGIMDYLTSTLHSLRVAGGAYQYAESPLKAQFREETAWLKGRKATRPFTTLRDQDPGTNYPRFYNRLRAIHLTDFKNHLKFQRRIAENPLSIVGVGAVGALEFAVKTTRDSDKIMENTHEAYLGINAVNGLLTSIPNFIYTFGLTSADVLVSEMVNGITMFDWLKGRDFKFPVYLDILLQLSLALEVAQQTCGFVHYDLFPWNIMLESQPFERTFEYVVGMGQVVTVKTRLVPIIIDYGKSHAYVNDRHFGFVNMFKMSTVQDMMSIILSSASIVFKEGRISRQDESTLISLVEFVNSARVSASVSAMSYSQAKRLASECSFSSMLVSDKGDLEKLRPLDFFNKFKTRNFTTTTRCRYVFNIGRVQSFFGIEGGYKIPDLENDMVKTLYFFRRLLNSYRGRVPKSVVLLRKKMGNECAWPALPLPEKLPPRVDISEETFHNRGKCREIRDNIPNIDSRVVDYLEMIQYLLAYEEPAGVREIVSVYGMQDGFESGMRIHDIKRCIADKNVMEQSGV
jgi:hypothetical protein